MPNTWWPWSNWMSAFASSVVPIYPNRKSDFMPQESIVRICSCSYFIPFLLDIVDRISSISNQIIGKEIARIWRTKKREKYLYKKIVRCEKRTQNHYHDIHFGIEITHSAFEFDLFSYCSVFPQALQVLGVYKCAILALFIQSFVHHYHNKLYEVIYVYNDSQ